MTTQEQDITNLVTQTPEKTEDVAPPREQTVLARAIMASESAAKQLLEQNQTNV
jgi:hypothetical protein